MIEQDYNIQASFYDEMMPKLTSDSPEIQAYAAILQGRRRIVEFGCGTGRISFPLIAKLAEKESLGYFLGLDNSSAMVDEALGKLDREDLWAQDSPPIEFKTADAASFSLPLSDYRFDAAFAFCGLTSLLGKEKLIPFFENAYRSLVSGGILLIDSLDPRATTLSAPVVNRTFTKVTDTSGLASFTEVDGDQYSAEFVWVSGSTAQRFTERSQLIPPELLQECALSAGFQFRKDISFKLQQDLNQINGPIMNLGAFIKP